MSAGAKRLKIAVDWLQFFSTEGFEESHERARIVCLGLAAVIIGRGCKHRAVSV